MVWTKSKLTISLFVIISCAPYNEVRVINVSISDHYKGVGFEIYCGIECSEISKCDSARVDISFSESSRQRSIEFFTLKNIIVKTKDMVDTVLIKHINIYLINGYSDGKRRAFYVVDKKFNTPAIQSAINIYIYAEVKYINGPLEKVVWAQTFGLVRKKGWVWVK